MIKLKISLLIIFFLVLKIQSQEYKTLTIHFVGMKSDVGKVYVGLHNTKKAFLKERCKEAIVVVNNKIAQVKFENLPLGEYSVSSFHDINDNGKLDTSFIGIPKEPIGVSNNAKGFMGPPKYKDAKFKFVDNKEITITIE